MTDNPSRFTVTEDDQIVTEARTYREARTNARKWGEIGDQARENILGIIEESTGEQDGEAVTASGVSVVRVTETLTKSFDRKRFQSDYPDIDLEPYMTPRVSRRVNIGSAV